jgi:hypothetical protein
MKSLVILWTWISKKKNLCSPPKLVSYRYVSCRTQRVYLQSYVPGHCTLPFSPPSSKRIVALNCAKSDFQKLFRRMVLAVLRTNVIVPAMKTNQFKQQVDSMSAMIPTPLQLSQLPNELLNMTFAYLAGDYARLTGSWHDHNTYLFAANTLWSHVDSVS